MADWKKRVQSKKFLGVLGGLVVLSILFYNVGISAAKVELGEEKASYDEVVAKYHEKDQDLDEITEKLKDLHFTYLENKEELDVAREAIQNETELKRDLRVLKEEKRVKEEELKDVQERVSSKQAELDRLNGDILKAEGKPLTIGAGQYIVGQDMDEGRYTVEPNGEGSNFFVYGSDGRATVNTILGNYGEASYTFFTSSGDIIQTEASVKLTPVQ